MFPTTVLALIQFCCSLYICIFFFSCSFPFKFISRSMTIFRFRHEKQSNSCMLNNQTGNKSRSRFSNTTRTKKHQGANFQSKRPQQWHRSFQQKFPVIVAAVGDNQKDTTRVVYAWRVIQLRVVETRVIQPRNMSWLNLSTHALTLVESRTKRMWVNMCGNYVWMHIMLPPIEACAEGMMETKCVFAAIPITALSRVKDTSFTVN